MPKKKNKIFVLDTNVILHDSTCIKNFEDNELKFRALLEAFTAAKEIKIGGLERTFLTRFIKPARRMAYNSSLVDIIGQLPRLTLEAISFGGLILVILFLISNRYVNRNSFLMKGRNYFDQSYMKKPAIAQLWPLAEDCNYETNF